MPTRIDAVTFAVTAGGVDISEYVVPPLEVRLGFDQRVPEATINLKSLPPGLDRWQSLVVQMGLVGTGCTGLATRLSGYVFDWSRDLWPYTFKLVGRGQLALADRVRVPEDDEAEGTLPIVPEFEAPGIDLSCDPATGNDWTDADMIVYVLGQCGVTVDAANIGGTGRKLGTIAFEQFTWRRGQSGLEFCEDLDRICLGYRTVELLDGTVVRRLVSPRTPFVDTRIDVSEGTHLLVGSSLAENGQAARNRIVVQGFDDGAGAVVAVATGPHPNPPPGVTYESELVSSPLIEVELAADVVDNCGLSCEEVANWKRDEYGYVMVEGEIQTWQDNLFQPGNTIYLTAPHLGIGSGAAPEGTPLWIKSVRITIAEDGSFTQTLGVRGPRPADAREAAVPGLAGLPVGLETNPWTGW